jgi:hypothetical protein
VVFGGLFIKERTGGLTSAKWLLISLFAFLMLDNLQDEAEDFQGEAEDLQGKAKVLQD